MTTPVKIILNQERKRQSNFFHLIKVFLPTNVLQSSLPDPGHPVYQLIVTMQDGSSIAISGDVIIVR